MPTYEITHADPTTGVSETHTVTADRAVYNEDRDLVLLFDGPPEAPELVGRFNSVNVFKKIST